MLVGRPLFRSYPIDVVSPFCPASDVSPKNEFQLIVADMVPLVMADGAVQFVVEFVVTVVVTPFFVVVVTLPPMSRLREIVVFGVVEPAILPRGCHDVPILESCSWIPGESLM